MASRRFVFPWPFSPSEHRRARRGRERDRGRGSGSPGREGEELASGRPSEPHARAAAPASDPHRHHDGGEALVLLVAAAQHAGRQVVGELELRRPSLCTTPSTSMR